MQKIIICATFIQLFFGALGFQSDLCYANSIEITGTSKKKPSLSFSCINDCRGIEITTNELLNTNRICVHETRTIKTINAANREALKQCIGALTKDNIKKIMPNYERKTMMKSGAQCLEWSLSLNDDGTEFMCVLPAIYDLAVSPLRESYYGVKALYNWLSPRKMLINQIEVVRDELLKLINEENQFNEENQQYVEIKNMNVESIENFFKRINCSPQ